MDIKINFLKEKINNFLQNKVWVYTFLALFIKTFVLLGLSTGGSMVNISLLAVFINIWNMFAYVCFITALLSFAFLFRGKGQLWFLVSVNLLLSGLFMFDLWNYRAFGNFISIHLIDQTANLNNLSDSIISMVRPYDLILIADLIILIYLCFRNSKYKKYNHRNIRLFALLLIIPIIGIQLVHYKEDILGKGKPHQLFRTCWSPSQTISNLSPIGYHIYDTYMYWKDSKPFVLEQKDKGQIKKWYEAKKEDLPDNRYKGLFAGKNLIIIQVESLEGFVINQKVNNQEVTPNLNRLIKNSLYFSEVHEQVHNGTSSDADLMINTSVYPIRSGSTFFRFPNNVYNSLPLLLQKVGYSTLAIHPDKGAYWNWMNALDAIGFQKCLDASKFKQDELIGLGLSDASFLKQVTPIVKSQKQPFYTFMVTLTSHGPFNLPKKYRELNLDENFNKTKLGGYFQSIHYTDKQLGAFLSSIKEDGILENTVIAIYGDHEGVHKFYQNEVTLTKPSENWWLKNDRHIPLIIYQSNLEGEQIKTIGGQIDILPTISYLMGIDSDSIVNTAMGRNLLKTEKNFVVLDTREYVGDSKDQNQRDEAIRGIDLADEIVAGNYFDTFTMFQKIP